MMLAAQALELDIFIIRCYCCSSSTYFFPSLLWLSENIPVCCAGSESPTQAAIDAGMFIM